MLGSGGLIGRSVVILLQERGYDVAEACTLPVSSSIISHTSSLPLIYPPTHLFTPSLSLQNTTMTQTCSSRVFPIASSHSNAHIITHPDSQVGNRTHLDLRVPGALDKFNGTDVRYCIFLACEVGGSKFIESSEMNVQLGIIESNIRIYQTVFPWLIEHKIPFAFTSSYLQVIFTGEISKSAPIVADILSAQLSRYSGDRKRVRVYQAAGGGVGKGGWRPRQNSSTLECVWCRGDRRKESRALGLVGDVYQR